MSGSLPDLTFESLGTFLKPGKLKSHPKPTKLYRGRTKTFSRYSGDSIVSPTLRASYALQTVPTLAAKVKIEN